MANMSKVELAMRADDPGVLNAWKKTKKGSSKVNNEGQHMDCNEPNVDMGEVYCEIISIIFPLQEAYIACTCFRHLKRQSIISQHAMSIFYLIRSCK